MKLKIDKNRNFCKIIFQKDVLLNKEKVIYILTI